MPTEHGGWGLTLEPALLGLLVARECVRGGTGYRGDDGVRSSHTLAGLVAAAGATSHGAFWVPVAIAAPLVAVELWFDMRSRSRRLLPELAGAIGIGSVAAAIVLADGG